MPRESNILLRLSDDEKAAFEKAAEVGGLSTSSWIRQKLRTAATGELKAVDMPVAFLVSVDKLNPQTIHAPENVPRDTKLTDGVKLEYHEDKPIVEPAVKIARPFDSAPAQ